ncbi:protein MCM10 homolog isoform X2 [Polypterus senegalus]|uniref:protein MCM10 homolog isoform X2 n=1 Tax=Polypterus senegalus TaxID=55291 RepID=UPI00196278D9|nr:protein MCM10 homolog isoform X2 [Polypterus senegalus]
MEGDADLDLLTSLIEENEAASFGCEDGLEKAEETDDLDDLFDMEEEEEEKEELLGGAEGDTGKKENVASLFGDIEDLNKEVQPVDQNQRNQLSSAVTQEKTKQDLEDELRQMQKKMQELKEQLKLTQKSLSSPSQKVSPPRKQYEFPVTTIGTKTEVRILHESPCFSSQLNAAYSQPKKKRTARQPNHQVVVEKSISQKPVVASTSSQSQQSNRITPTQSPISTARHQEAAALKVSPVSRDIHDVAVEKFSGLRIKKPRVSSMEMEHKMSGRRLIRLSQLPDKLLREKLDESDWVTFGVVVSKVTPQSSNSGKTFSIWRLCDLRNLDTYVSLFLFGDVHKEHWKTESGSVIGILNPNQMKPKDGSDGVSLSVDHPQKILLMGEAIDFGTCKAKKKNGEPCTQIVNLDLCPFCQYHVNAQYKKLSSKRAELQSSYSGKAPNKYKRNGSSLKERLCQSGFHYGGISSPAFAASLAATVPRKPSQTTLSSLFIKGADSIVKEAQKSVLSSKISQSSDDFKELLKMPTPGALNLHHLSQGKVSAGSAGKPVTGIQSITASQLIKQQKQQMLAARRKKSEDIQKRFLESTLKTGCPETSEHLSPKAADTFPGKHKTMATPLAPKLGGGLEEGEDILLFDSPLPVQELPMSAAKKVALRKVRERGTLLTKEDPNNIKRKRSEAILSNIAKRAEKSLSSPEEEKEGIEPALKKRREQMQYLQSAEFQDILNAKSRHTEVLNEAEREIQEQYFEPLVKKEQMEEKMKNIKEMKCRAVTCKTCKYTYFKPLDKCVNENHDYHWHDAMKRFFRCQCGQRAISLDRLPHKHCSNCGLFKWERDGMLKEKTGPKIGAELLLPRGEEHAKFLNSLK